MNHAHRSNRAARGFAHVAHLARALALGALLVSPLAVPLAAAEAVDYTDHWSNPDQNGWGVALTQGNNAIYTEIFHYGGDGKPLWFGGTVYRLTDTHFQGALYTVTGDYFGHTPYNPSLFTATVAGAMDLVFSDTNHGTLTFSVNGINVTTPVQRLSLDAIPLSGNYLGAFVQDLSKDCNQSGNASTDYVPSQVIVTQTGSPGTVYIEFRDVTSPYGTLYTMYGAATQIGKAFDIPVATYGNTQQTFTSLHVYDLRRTSNGGIEGRWKTVAGTSDTCVDQGRFSGVTQ